MPATEAGEPRPPPPDGLLAITLPVPTAQVESQVGLFLLRRCRLRPPKLNVGRRWPCLRRGRRRVPAASLSFRVSGVSYRDTKGTSFEKTNDRFERPREGVTRWLEDLLSPGNRVAGPDCRPRA